ncbi:XRE family transcriptional regulator [Bradyrhizobium sp. 21]|uniref:helix-turn-helix domain-containing protein n=1 Tax=Bradyrhizobium sp. 21 TaxID=2782666 RepID=UPI001FF7993B|nr:cupin domain-containing protein [Bradyrhizobium sp. 21]
MSGGKRIRKPAAAKPAKKAKPKARARAKAIAKPAEPAMDVAVGRRIRDLRRIRQFSLETVASRTDLSIGFLSQIERGLSSPSLRVLATLADVLGVGIAALFGASPSADGASDHVVTRGLQRPELKLWRTGVSKQLLSPASADNKLNLFLVHLEPGGSTGDELYTHDGEEAGLVLEGEMLLTVDSETWSLKTGDSFRFGSRRPHRFSNPAQDAKTVVLWVNCVTGPT